MTAKNKIIEVEKIDYVYISMYTILCLLLIVCFDAVLLVTKDYMRLIWLILLIFNLNTFRKIKW